MRPSDLHRAVARVTGESFSAVRRRGFSLLGPDLDELDMALDVEPRVLDWDELDAARDELPAWNVGASVPAF